MKANPDFAVSQSRMRFFEARNCPYPSSERRCFQLCAFLAASTSFLCLSKNIHRMLIVFYWNSCTEFSDNKKRVCCVCYRLNMRFKIGRFCAPYAILNNYNKETLLELGIMYVLIILLPFTSSTVHIALPTAFTLLVIPCQASSFICFVTLCFGLYFLYNCLSVLYNWAKLDNFNHWISLIHCIK